MLEEAGQDVMDRKACTKEEMQRQLKLLLEQ